MDLIGDIKVQGEIIKRRRVIPVVVVVLAALAATIAVYAKEGSGKKRKRKRDSASFQTAADLADDGIDTPTSNQSGASGRENPSTSLSRRPKRKKGSMVGSMDAICKVIRELSAGLREPLKIENSALENDVANVYNALKAIPTAADLADDGIDAPTSNQSGASGRENPSTSLSRRPKRKKGSMVGSMDAICKVIRELSAGLREPLKIEISALENDVANVYKALKAIPDLTQGTMLDAYEHFLLEPARARVFLRMNEEERVTYITRKFGGL